MFKQKITPVILAGGQGKRLWPISYASRPKQFIPLIKGKSLFEQTIERCGNRELFYAPIIVGAKRHEDIIRELSPEDARIALEEYGKNTAPAIALALREAARSDTLMIMPADHFIPDVKGFENTAIAAAGQALRDFIVTIGIPPSEAHTGYGYIQNNDYGDVERFHEKPDKMTAQNYIENPHMFWNSGIFTATYETLCKEYKMHAPEILRAIEDQEALKRLKPISFDYAIAEKTFNAVMVEAQFAWSDIGDWNALISLKAGKI